MGQISPGQVCSSYRPLCDGRRALNSHRACELRSCPLTFSPLSLEPPHAIQPLSSFPRPLRPTHPIPRKFGLDS
eukprot:3293511-Pleurochrysis_carterae.AAC.1